MTTVIQNRLKEQSKICDTRELFPASIKSISNVNKKCSTFSQSRSAKSHMLAFPNWKQSNIDVQQEYVSKNDQVLVIIWGSLYFVFWKEDLFQKGRLVSKVYTGGAP